MQDLKMVNKTQEVVFKCFDAQKIEMVFTCDDAVFLQNNIYQAIKKQSVFLWEFLAHDKNTLQMIISFSSPKKSNNYQVVAQFLSKVDFGNESIKNKINISMLPEILPLEIQKTIYSGLSGSDLISLACVNKSRNKFFNDLKTSANKDDVQIKRLYLGEIIGNKTKKYLQKFPTEKYGAIYIPESGCEDIKEILSEFGYVNFVDTYKNPRCWESARPKESHYGLFIIGSFRETMGMTSKLFEKINSVLLIINEMDVLTSLLKLREMYFHRCQIQIISTRKLKDDEKKHLESLAIPYKESECMTVEIGKFIVDGVKLARGEKCESNFNCFHEKKNELELNGKSLEHCFDSLITLISQTHKTDYISLLQKLEKIYELVINQKEPYSDIGVFGGSKIKDTQIKILEKRFLEGVKCALDNSSDKYGIIDIVNKSKLMEHNNFIGRNNAQILLDDYLNSNPIKISSMSQK